MFKVTLLLVVSLSVAMGQNLNWQTQIQTQLQQLLQQYQSQQYQANIQQWQQYYANLPVNVQQYIQQVTQMYAQQLPLNVQQQLQQFFNQNPSSKQGGYYMPGPSPVASLNGTTVQQGELPPPMPPMPPMPPQGTNGTLQNPPPRPPPNVQLLPSTNGTTNNFFQPFQFFPPPPPTNGQLPSVNATLSGLFKLIQQQKQSRAQSFPPMNVILANLQYLQTMDSQKKQMISDLYKAYVAGGYEGAKKEFMTTYKHIYDKYATQIQMYLTIVPEAQIASFVNTVLSNPTVAAAMASLGNTQQSRALYIPTMTDILSNLQYLQMMDPTMKKMYSDLYKAYVAGGYEGAKKEFLTTYKHIYDQYAAQFQMYFSIVPEAQIASFINNVLSNPTVAAAMASLGN